MNRISKESVRGGAIAGLHLIIYLIVAALAIFVILTTSVDPAIVALCAVIAWIVVPRLIARRL